jgi:hypothetical protein
LEDSVDSTETGEDHGILRSFGREDKVDAQGKVSLRYMSKLYKIGLGRAHKGRQVKLLIADQNIRVITPDGELLRELTLDPSHKYQPLRQA